MYYLLGGSLFALQSTLCARLRLDTNVRNGLMNTKHKMVLATLVGAALGAAAVQGLHAQAKSKAYQITESEVLDATGLATYNPVIQAAQKAAGGRSLRTTGKIV